MDSCLLSGFLMLPAKRGLHLSVSVCRVCRSGRERRFTTWSFLPDLKKLLFSRPFQKKGKCKSSSAWSCWSCCGRYEKVTSQRTALSLALPIGCSPPMKSCR